MLEWRLLGYAVGVAYIMALEAIVWACIYLYTRRDQPAAVPRSARRTGDAAVTLPASASAPAPPGDRAEVHDLGDGIRGWRCASPMGAQSRAEGSGAPLPAASGDRGRPHTHSSAPVAAPSNPPPAEAVVRGREGREEVEGHLRQRRRAGDSGAQPVSEVGGIGQSAESGVKEEEEEEK